MAKITITLPVTSSGGSSNTNLSYISSPVQGTISSDTGTDAIIPLADITNAGLISSVEKSEIATALQPSDITNLVPYIGATTNVDLGEYQLKTGQIELDLTPTGVMSTGKVRWNDSDGTIEVMLKGGNVTLQIGQELITRVVNKTGANLLESEYKVVYISGAQGNRLKCGLAIANNDIFSNTTLGLVTENITNNTEGFITSSGLVRGINTTGSLQSETWLEGDVLYLSPTIAGQLTNIQPIAPDHLTMVGYVVNPHITQGSIYVKVQVGYSLNELHNVLITTPTNDDALIYESSTSLWKNKSILSTLNYIPEDIVNKSDSYTISSTTTYVNTKALVDGLATKEPLKGIDDNYVTDAEKVVIGNTSGINTGDNATNTQYSGLTASKQDTLVSGTNIKTLDSDTLLGSGNLLPKTELAYALSDETSNLTVGTLITFRMPFAMTLSEVRISLNNAPTISSVIVDVKEGGVSIFSTLLSIDATEKTSVTAATPAVISDVNLADDAEITISTTQIGSGDTGKGLKILFKGRKA